MWPLFAYGENMGAFPGKEQRCNEEYNGQHIKFKSLKRKKKEKALQVTDTINWIDEIFIPLMETMEKSVMYTVQEEFNGFFQKWFSILMGTENLSVYVDDRFSPVIEQEIYQTEYSNLSGGEKTAVDLAYRLALTKVIK